VTTLQVAHTTMIIRDFPNVKINLNLAGGQGRKLAQWHLWYQNKALRVANLLIMSHVGQSIQPIRTMISNVVSSAPWNQSWRQVGGAV